MRILFVKLSSIGDVVHTLPALASVKRAFPSSEVSWAVETRCAELLKNNPLLRRLIEVDTKALRRKDVLGKTLKAARKQFRELRASEFDLSIDFQGNFKSATLAKLAKVEKRYGFSKENLRERPSGILLDQDIVLPTTDNVVSKNIGLAEGALQDFTGDRDLKLLKTYEFTIATSESERLEAEDIVRANSSDFALLNPAGGWVTKLWPAERFGELADLIWDAFGISSIVSIGPGEDQLAEDVLKASKTASISIEKPGLKAFFELSKRARIYVGGDTAPTHLAVAAGTPVVGIFGPTEWWRNGSINGDDICVERNDIDCRVNCHRRTCDNWICMDIPAETVFRAVAKRIGLEGQV